MQSVPHVLGVAHPTGYPTYVLLAWFAELLPIGSVAWRANLLSAVLVVGHRGRDGADPATAGRRRGRRGGGGACARGGPHGLGGGHRGRGQPAPPPVHRAAPPPRARLGGERPATGPGPRRAPRRSLAREPPAHGVCGPVHRRIRDLGGPSRPGRSDRGSLGGRRGRGAGRVVGLPVPPDRGEPGPSPPLQPPRDRGCRLVARERAAIPRPVRFLRGERPPDVRRFAPVALGIARGARHGRPADPRGGGARRSSSDDERRSG